MHLIEWAWLLLNGHAYDFKLNVIYMLRMYLRAVFNFKLNYSFHMIAEYISTQTVIYFLSYCSIGYELIIFIFLKGPG